MGSAVCFPLVRDPNHQHHQFVIQDFVYDSIVADPEPSQTPQSALEQSPGQRLFSEGVYSMAAMSRALAALRLIRTE